MVCSLKSRFDASKRRTSAVKNGVFVAFLAFESNPMVLSLASSEGFRICCNLQALCLA